MLIERCKKHHFHARNLSCTKVISPSLFQILVIVVAVYYGMIILPDTKTLHNVDLAQININLDKNLIVGEQWLIKSFVFKLFVLQWYPTIDRRWIAIYETSYQAFLGFSPHIGLWCSIEPVTRLYWPLVLTLASEVWARARRGWSPDQHILW